MSEAVLEGITRALQLDDAERAHLYDLVRAANEGMHPGRRRGNTRPTQIRPSLQQLIDSMTDVPVVIQNGRLDILATNQLGHAVFSELYVQPQRPANFGRFVFLDRLADPFYRDWADAAYQTVALLRAEAGRAPHDRILSDLVGELSTRSDRFRTLWASHDVREHRTGTKSITHPVVGDLDLRFEAMDLSSDRGLQLIAYSAAPGSATAERLKLLASWTVSDPAATSSAPARPGHN